jgi:hypothetical protein
MSRYDYSIIPIEQRKINEEKLNNEPLQYIISINKFEVKTIGELKKYINSNETILKLEPFLSEEHYHYLSTWFYIKLNIILIINFIKS